MLSKGTTSVVVVLTQVNRTSYNSQALLRRISTTLASTIKADSRVHTSAYVDAVVDPVQNLEADSITKEASCTEQR
jgi:hypothetical protein